MQLSRSGAGDVHYIVRTGIATELNNLVAVPMIAPRASAEGLFVSNQGAAIEVFINLG